METKIRQKTGHKEEVVLLENGVEKQTDRFGVNFSKEEEIDGLKYRFDLSTNIKGKDWHLGFSTEHGMLVTNKGLAVYRKIIDNIIILINTARTNEKINEIYFFGADEEIRINELEEFKNFLKTKLENGKNMLDNFSYITDRDGLKKSIHIKDGKVLIEISGERRRTIRDRIKNRHPVWNRTERWSIDEFIDNQYELAELLKDKEMFSSLMRHIGSDFSLGRNIENKDTAKLRTDLYERTLKQRFPDYKFEREGQGIRLYLK